MIFSITINQEFYNVVGNEWPNIDYNLLVGMQIKAV